MVEFSSGAVQDIIDRYVNGEEVSFAELRHVWTGTAGWFPGPAALGYVNFYANVRAANLEVAERPSDQGPAGRFQDRLI